MPRQPEYISLNTLPEIKALLAKWVALLDEIRLEILRISPELEKAEKHKSSRQRIVAELGMAQFFTFSSIAFLVTHWHFHDAFTLLRTLYEGHLHLWFLSNCSEDELNRYIHLQAIHEWDIANQLLPIKNNTLQELYYNKDTVAELKAEYEHAIQYFNCKPGKIPRNYTTTPLLNIAKQIDNSEGGTPYREIMHTRLYSSGSEYVHRTLYSIREGMAILPSEKSHVLSQNPRRGIEACWWAASIELDCLEWQSNSQHYFQGELVAGCLKNRVRELAKEWLLTPKIESNTD